MKGNFDAYVLDTMVQKWIEEGFTASNFRVYHVHLDIAIYEEVISNLRNQ